MTPKQFLTIGGVALVLIGLLGMWGIIGLTAEQSIFDWAHLIFGLVAMTAAWALSTPAQRSVTILLGLGAILVAVYDLFTDGALILILHAALGVWALYAGLNKKAQ